MSKAFLQDFCVKENLNAQINPAFEGVTLIKGLSPNNCLLFDFCSLTKIN